MCKEIEKSDKIENYYNKLSSIFLRNYGKNFPNNRKIYEELFNLIYELVPYKLCVYVIKLNRGIKVIESKKSKDITQEEKDKFISFLKNNIYRSSPDNPKNKLDFKDSYYIISLVFNKEILGYFGFLYSERSIPYTKLVLLFQLNQWVALELKKQSYFKKVKRDEKRLRKKNRHLELINKTLEEERIFSIEKTNAMARLFKLAYNPEREVYRKEIKKILFQSLGIKKSFYIFFNTDEEKFFQSLEKELESFCGDCELQCEGKSILRDKLIEFYQKKDKIRRDKIFIISSSIKIGIFPVFFFSPEKHLRKMIGFLTICFPESYYLTNSKRAFLQTIADFIGVIHEFISLYEKYKENERITYELEMAEEIQRGLLPKEFPQYDKIDVYGYIYFHKWIGGDFFDVYQISPKKMGCLVGDVCGKGLTAALKANLLWSQFSIFSKEYVRDDERLKQMYQTLLDNGRVPTPDELLSLIDASYRDPYPDDVVFKLNNKIVDFLDDFSFVTVIHFLFNFQNDLLYICNAGHLPLLCYRKKEDKFYFLGEPSPPVGLEKGVKYKLNNFKFQEGDIFVAYTDGVLESRRNDLDNETIMKKNIEDLIFGSDRLKEVVKKSAHFSSKKITEEILRTVNEFSNGNYSDDLTIVVFKIKGD